MRIKQEKKKREISEHYGLKDFLLFLEKNEINIVNLSIL
jgi:hypothetical protein